MHDDLPVRKGVDLLLHVQVLLGPDIQGPQARLVLQEEVGRLKLPVPERRPGLALDFVESGCSREEDRPVGVWRLVWRLALTCVVLGLHVEPRYSEVGLRPTLQVACAVVDVHWVGPAVELAGLGVRW